MRRPARSRQELGYSTMQTPMLKTVEAIRVDDRLTLIVGQEPTLSLFEATVLNIVNGSVIVSDPTYVEGNLKLKPGLPITIQLCRGGSVLQCESAIHSIKEGEMNEVVLNPPRSFQSVQRREYVRLDFRRDVLFALVPNDIRWRDWEDQLVWHKATTCDLSGNGLLLEKADEISEGTLLLLRLPFFGEIGIGHPVMAICRRAPARERGLPVGVEFILGRSLGEHLAKDDLSMLPRAAVQFDILEQVKLSHFVLSRQIRRRREERT